MSQHEIVDKARELLPLICADKPDGDLQAKLTNRVVQACGEAGLFRMAAPKEVGGLELLPPDVIATTQIVSTADPAVGWYMLNSMAAGYLAAYIGEQEREALFAAPDANFCFAFMPGGKATPMTGGFELSGFWPVMTGGLDAHWAVLVAAMDGDEEDHREFIVPTEALRITDSWRDVSAMRGTASNGVHAENIFVPEGFVVGAEATPVIDRPYYRLPAIAHIFPADAAVILGLMETCLTSMTTALSGHSAAITGEHRRDQNATQELIVRSTYTTRAAGAALREVCNVTAEHILTGTEIGAKQRAELYAVATQILDVGREVASDLFAGGTRDAFLRNHPLESALKDLHAIAYARSATRFVVHSSGRVLLGGEHDPGL